jgi:hypothetical protein
LKQADGGSVRWCGGGPCVAIAAASVDTSAPGESDGHKQAYIRSSISTINLLIHWHFLYFCSKVRLISWVLWPQASLFYLTWLTAETLVIGIENEKCSEKMCFSAILFTTNPTQTALVLKNDLCC